MFNEKIYILTKFLQHLQMQNSNPLFFMLWLRHQKQPMPNIASCTHVISCLSIKNDSKLYQANMKAIQTLGKVRKTYRSCMPAGHGGYMAPFVK